MQRLLGGMVVIIQGSSKVKQRLSMWGETNKHTHVLPQLFVAILPL